MKVPKFSPLITIPVLFTLNFLAWLYIYDDYMMGWVIIYPIFMLVITAFTITAEIAFGKPKRYKYIGINVCVVLLLLVLAQRFIPMDKIEQGLRDNYYAHVNADVSLKAKDVAVKGNGVSIVARNFRENAAKDNPNSVDEFQVFKNEEVIDEITLEEAIKKIVAMMSVDKKALFNDVYFIDVRYAGLKQKGGALGLSFLQGHVYFKYNLSADENGFIWDQTGYKFAGLEMPHKENLFDEESNKKFKQMLIRGEKEQIIVVEIKVQGEKSQAITTLQNQGYELIAEDPVTVKIPFYQLANLAYEEYVEQLKIQ